MTANLIGWLLSAWALGSGGLLKQSLAQLAAVDSPVRVAAVHDGNFRFVCHKEMSDEIRVAPSAAVRAAAAAYAVAPVEQPTARSRSRGRAATGRWVVAAPRDRNRDRDRDDQDADNDDDEDQGEAAPPARGAWIGVQAGPVPKALAAHLKNSGGTLILNVAEDSPAAKAGLQQYDVLIELNGVKLDESDKPLRDVVGKLKSGQAISARVVRGGSEQTMQITLETRPNRPDGVRYKYELPDASETRVETMPPRMWTLDKNGRFVEPDSDSLLKLKGLMPQFAGKAGDGTVEQGNVSIIRNNDDGEKIEIKRVNNGKITVKRTDDKGVTTTSEYKTMKALREGDPEAARLMRRNVIAFRTGNGNDGGTWSFGDPADPDQVQLQFGEAMKQAEEAMRQAEQQGFMARGRDGQGFRWSNRAGGGVRFETKPDGSIQVTTRKGGDELSQQYKNEEELKREKPALYRRYVEMKSRSTEKAEQDPDEDE